MIEWKTRKACLTESKHPPAAVVDAVKARWKKGTKIEEVGEELDEAVDHANEEVTLQNHLQRTLIGTCQGSAIAEVPAIVVEGDLAREENVPPKIPKGTA